MTIGYKLPPTQGQRLISLLEERRIDYQVWNIEETLTNPNAPMEIEVDERDGETLRELVSTVAHTKPDS